MKDLSAIGALIFIWWVFAIAKADDNQDDNVPGTDDTIEPKLYNGKEAIPFAYPFTVWFEGISGYQGQGAIIDPHTVILDGRLGLTKGKDFIIIAGRHKSKVFSATEQTRQACNNVRHPQYDDKTRHNSYQLMHLSDPFVFNEYVNSIPLAPPGFNPTSKCLALSRGRTGEGGILPTETLLQKDVQILENSRCPGANSPTLACSTNAGCPWDDGMSLICSMESKTVLFGVRTYDSQTGPCELADHKTIYASIANLNRTWVRQEQEKAMRATSCIFGGKASPVKRSIGEDEETKIANGIEAVPHMHNFLVIFNQFGGLESQKYNESTCLGVLFDAYTVLTSITCSKRIEGNKWMRAIAGAHDLSKKEVTVQTRAICKIDPYHTGSDTTIDSYAIIHLNDPFQLNEYVEPIAMYQDIEVPIGTECIVAGWGNYRNSMRPWNVLRQKVVTIMDPKSCAGMKWNHSSHICTTPALCVGDIGAALICTQENRRFALAIGVAQQPGTCQAQTMSLFASIQRMNITWFQEKIKQAENTCRPFNVIPS